MRTLRPKDREPIVNALRAGVVPKVGLQHLQVGRRQEISSVIRDIERVSGEGSAFRLVIGEYGAGKSFFLNLVRNVALEKKLVVLSGELSPDRRLYGSSGHAVMLYRDLIQSASTRSRPEGNALQPILEGFINSIRKESTASQTPFNAVLQGKLNTLSDQVCGYDFSKAVELYHIGHERGDETLIRNALRWLRGELATKSEAKSLLGVRSIVDDETVFDFLKVLADFVKVSGFNGLWICIDEAVNLFKMANKQARNSNYEQILRILNSALQGSMKSIGFMLGGTPDFLYDTRRGLFSYEALKSRLERSSLISGDHIDFSGPVLQLSSLTQEEFYVLLENILFVYYGSDEPTIWRVPHESIEEFMNHCESRLGAEYFKTPRMVVRGFVQMLSILEQDASLDWRDILHGSEIEQDKATDDDGMTYDDDLANLRL